MNVAGISALKNQQELQELFFLWLPEHQNNILLAINQKPMSFHTLGNMVILKRTVTVTGPLVVSLISDFRFLYYVRR